MSFLEMTPPPNLLACYPDLLACSKKPRYRWEYTMTWLALVALREIYGAVPDAVSQKVRKVFTAIEPQSGGYGRPVLLRTGPIIHPTARHTAMALLTRIHFIPELRPNES